MAAVVATVSMVPVPMVAAVSMMSVAVSVVAVVMAAHRQSRKKGNSREREN